jgi:uncharacterized protein YegL
MRSDLTDITLVVDRSGSMQQIREDAEGGVNAFIADQTRQPGEALLTLVQFDSDFEFLHQGVPVQQVPKYSLVPRGSTALLDAVGRAINETGERLEKMAEPDRPGLVIFVVMTDGRENSSREFTKLQLKEMIERQQQVYSWNFTFLGANQDSFGEAGRLGVDAAGIANWKLDKAAAVYDALASKVRRMRTQKGADVPVSNEFTDEEREQMN